VRHPTGKEVAMRIVRWVAAMLGGVVLALAFVATSGSIALVAWDRTHPPLLPGLVGEKQGPGHGHGFVSHPRNRATMP
jgi:hypothetical protein